jgi:tRNA U38,U39,U40 pseudouridine synthase TruA
MGIFVVHHSIDSIFAIAIIHLYYNPAVRQIETMMAKLIGKHRFTNIMACGQLFLLHRVQKLNEFGVQRSGHAYNWTQASCRIRSSSSLIHHSDDYFFIITFISTRRLNCIAHLK